LDKYHGQVGKLNWLRVSSKVEVQVALKELGIDGIRRAETLTIEEFGALYAGMKS